MRRPDGCTCERRAPEDGSHKPGCPVVPMVHPGQALPASTFPHPALDALLALVDAVEEWDDKPSGDNSYELSMAAMRFRKSGLTGSIIREALADGLALRGWHTRDNAHPNTDGSPWGWVVDSRGREVDGLTWSGRAQRDLLERVFAARAALSDRGPRDE